MTIQAPPLRGFAIAPGAQDFGTWFVGDGDSNERPFVITSTGLDPVTVRAIVLAGADAAQFALSGASSCERELAPGSSCVVLIGFDPSTDGDKAAELRVAGDAPGGTITGALSGRAVTGAAGARTTGDPLFPQSATAATTPPTTTSSSTTTRPRTPSRPERGRRSTRSRPRT